MKKAANPYELTTLTNQNSKANSTRITVKEAVLNALKAGEQLTHLEAWSRFGTSRLSSFIHELRKEGYNIKTNMVRVEAGTGKATEHKADIAVYSLAGGAE